MYLFSKKVLQALLRKYRIFPKKGFGQNFLIDKRAARKIIKAADLKAKDIILEIGPGTGNLTRELAPRVKKVISVEKDSQMVEILRETMRDLKNVKIIEGDILKINTKYKIQNTNYKIVANLPYYIVSPVIRKFLELTEARPLQMILMVQKEVAQRICAKPPHMSLLSVSVQFYAEPQIISFVSKKSFWPQPKVDSAILKISNIRSAMDRRRRSAFNQRFFRIARAGFSQPRKQLINNLSEKLKIDRGKIKVWLFKNEVRPEQRAESLSIRDWTKLTNTFPFA